jgi:hypothetical protein
MCSTNILERVSLFIQRVYRLIRVNQRAEIVWHELIKLHKEGGWKFGQFDKDKYIESYFQDDDMDLKCHYEVTSSKLRFRALILNEFSIEYTNHILVLASHFNGLLNFGSVRVDLGGNYIEFYYAGELVLYMLYPAEIYDDMLTHFNISKHCCEAFHNLIETGEDPVFIFSEFLKRMEKRDQD